MPIKTTLTFSQDDRAHMDEMVNRGRYVSISDYVRSLVRMDRVAQDVTPDGLAALREKLRRSEQSGYVDMSREELLEHIRAEAKADGGL